jgi:hypothetical protein
VRTIEGASSGVSGWSASKFSSRPHSEEAGDQATGLKVPLAIRASASPEEALMPSTKTTRPPTSSRLALNALISGRSSFSFSGE